MSGPTLEACSPFTLKPKSVAGFRLARLARRFGLEYVGDIGWRCGSNRPDVYAGHMCRQSVLCVFPPRSNGPFGLGGLAEYEPREHVKAAQGEEEEGRDERKFVHVVREDGCSEAGATISVIVYRM